jgi:cell division protease FtsH
MTFGKKEEQIFLGRDFTQVQDYAEATAQEIDQEVGRFLRESYERAKKLLEENIDTLHKLAELLLERESLDAAEIEEIVSGSGGERAVPPMNAVGAGTGA